jgi:hypothetical protein
MLWKTMFRPAFKVVWLLVSLTRPLYSQADSARSAPDSVDVLVLDHHFNGPNEFVRVFLQNGQVYRAELGASDLELQIRGVIRTVEVPRVYAFLPSETPSGTSMAEIYPRADAEYEIRALRVGGGGIATRLRLYRDVKASRRRHHVLNSPGWEIGVELAGGWHSGFGQSSAPPSPLASDPEAGTDVEACFSARRAPGIPILSMCALGLGYQSQSGAPSILWIYSEPRLRFLGEALPGRSNWELGVLFRLGLGMISRSPDSPLLLGPGLYAARHIRTNSKGAGWSLQASYSWAWFRGFSKPLGTRGEVIPKSHRVLFGVGWYQ